MRLTWKNGLYKVRDYLTFITLANYYSWRMKNNHFLQAPKEYSHWFLVNLHPKNIVTTNLLLPLGMV
jgi:hypothetical protein